MPHSHTLAARVSMAWTISRPLGRRVAVEASTAGGGTTHRLLLLRLHTSQVIHCNFTPLTLTPCRAIIQPSHTRAVRCHAVMCMLAVVVLVNSRIRWRSGIINPQLRVLVRHQFSLPAYMRVTNFCHIFGRRNGGRLIRGTAYTRVYTLTAF